MFAQVDGFYLDALVDHHLGEAQLAVELQRARVHRHRARGLSRPAVFIDDADNDTPSRQRNGEH
jgi:hypothetical protein